MSLTGIIDIGSNSIRLSLIRMLDNGSFFVIDEQKSTPRLANSLDRNGNMKKEGIKELVFHLREFLDICVSYQTDEVIAIGTAALRMAKNQQEIIASVNKELGLEVDIISGHEEAFLGYIAVAHTMDMGNAYLIDIGGGSTEVSLVQNGQITATHSFPFGAVTMSNHFQAGSDAENLKKVIPQIKNEFSSILGPESPRDIEVVGIGGTIRNIAGIHQSKTGYTLPITHNYYMTISETTGVIQSLSLMTLAQRKKLDGLSKGRADVIVPGGAILVALLETVNAKRLRISGRGLRDGVFYARVLRQTITPVPVLQNSVRNILVRYFEAKELAEHRTRLALQMFRDAAATGLVPPDSERILYTAAQLHRIGVRVDFYHYESHTFYLLLNSAVYGLSHREILLAAAAAAYNGKSKIRKLCAPYMPTIITEAELDLAARLGVLVKMAEALDRRHEQRVMNASIMMNGQVLELYLPDTNEADVEWSNAQNLSPHVKKVFGKELKVIRSDMVSPVQD